MQINDKFKNIHTGVTVKIQKIEIVDNEPLNITVYTLCDGERWSKEMLIAHHVKVGV